MPKGLREFIIGEAINWTSHPSATDCPTWFHHDRQLRIALSLEMCDLLITPIKYSECKHIVHSSIRTTECDDYKKDGKCENEKRKYLGQTTKREECRECQTASAQPDPEEWSCTYSPVERKG